MPKLTAYVYQGWLAASLIGCAPSFALAGNKVRVAVASATPSKLQAAPQAWQWVSPEVSVEVVSSPQASGVPEQPLGYDVGLEGARKRLQGLRESERAKQPNARASHLLAIESYLVVAGAKAYDQAVIILVDTAHPEEELVAVSAAVELPLTSWSAYSRALGPPSSKGWAQTFGAFYSLEHGQKVDAHDWYEAARAGGEGRATLLADAVFRAAHTSTLQRLAAMRQQIPDFPRAGVLFQDHGPLLADGKSFAEMTAILAKRFADQGISAIVGLDARGFIIGGALAREMKLGFVPVRKAGKLPPPFLVTSYTKEYGEDQFAIGVNALIPEQRVLIVDDLVATGGSAAAAVRLVEQLGAVPVAVAALSNVPYLGGREALSIPYFALFEP